MGYYVSITDADCTIPVADAGEAFYTLTLLDDSQYDKYKSGGRWSQGKQTSKWFAWMPEKLESLGSLQGILEHMGFEVSEEQVLGVDVLRITDYDSKSGDEDYLMATIAPWVTKGSWIEWRGEDGEQWRWEFDGSRMLRREGLIHWGEAKPMVQIIPVSSM